jgi:hypothetical protein
MHTVKNAIIIMMITPTTVALTFTAFDNNNNMSTNVEATSASFVDDGGGYTAARHHRTSVEGMWCNIIIRLEEEHQLVVCSNTHFMMQRILYSRDTHNTHIMPFAESDDDAFVPHP